MDQKIFLLSIRRPKVKSRAGSTPKGTHHKGGYALRTSPEMSWDFAARTKVLKSKRV